MDEIDLLRRLGAQEPPPDPSAKQSARRRLLQDIKAFEARGSRSSGAEGPPALAERGPRRRAGRRPGLLVAALAALLVIMVVGFAALLRPSETSVLLESPAPSVTSTSAPPQGGSEALLHVQVIPEPGPLLYTEGAVTYVQVLRGDEVLVERGFLPGQPAVLQASLLAGDYRLQSFLRPCEGACPAEPPPANTPGLLDPPVDHCEAEVSVAPGEGVEATVTLRPGADCSTELFRWSLPHLDRPCLPEDVRLVAQGKGATAAILVWVSAEPAGSFSCRLDAPLELALTDAAGHLLEVEGNPAEGRLRGTLTPGGDPIIVRWAWENWCDQGAVGLELGGPVEEARAQAEAPTVGRNTAEMTPPRCDVPTEASTLLPMPPPIEAVQINGVWVFQHRPDVIIEALHSGFPEIRDGCLYVDDTIVVWHADRIEEAEEAVAAAKRGERPQLLIGGGGISLDEGAAPDDIPAVITERCPASAVWFGGP